MAESSSPHEDSKSSSDETDRSDQNYEYLGSGRSYECVFCKRGFTTAQALGGHMNIHRKHRAPKTTNPSNNYSADHDDQDPLVSSKSATDNDNHREGYANFRPFFAIQSYPPLHFAHHDDHKVHVKYQTYNNNFSTTWDSTTNSTIRPSQEFNYLGYNSNYDLLRENWRGTALSLGIGEPQHDDDDPKISGDFGEDHVEVDLELRLGYDPN